MIRYLFLSFLFLTVISYSQINSKDSVSVFGQITLDDTEAPLVKAKLEIFKNDSIQYASIFTNDSGTYYFKVPAHNGSIFRIRVSYPDLIPKVFEINTKDVPPHLHSFKDIEAAIFLFKGDSTVNYQLLDLPMIRYSFDPLLNNFSYDKNYFEAMLSSLENFKKIEDKLIKEREQERIILRQNSEKQLQEKEISKQKLMRNFALSGITFLFLFSISILLSLRKNKKQKKEILEKHNKIEAQNRVIEEKQKEIIDSIRYARRIQNSLLPTEKYIKKIFDNKT